MKLNLSYIHEFLISLYFCVLSKNSFFLHFATKQVSLSVSDVVAVWSTVVIVCSEQVPLV